MTLADISYIFMLVAIAVCLLLTVRCAVYRNTPAALGWAIAAMWATIHLFSTFY